MERYTMFLNWKNQYYENDYTTQSNIQIQYSPCQTTNGIFHRTKTKNFTICMETQKTPNSKSSLEKEEGSWRNQSSDLRLCYKPIIIKTEIHKYISIHRKQKYKPMEPGENPEINPRTYGHLIFDKGGKTIQWRKDTLFNK